MKSSGLPPLFALSLISLALVGCPSSPEKPNQPIAPLLTSQPDWVLQPPADSSTTLYGLGSGKNRTEAIQNALADLTAKLGVKVNAQFTSTLSVKNRGFEWVKQDAQKTVSTQNETLTLSHYEVLNSHQPLPTQVTVLIKTDRQRLAAEAQQTLQQAVDKAPWLQPTWANLGVITQYQLAEKTLNSLPNFQRQLSLLKTLTPQQSYPTFEHYQTLTESTFLKTQTALRFQVVAKNAASAPYANSLQQHLAKAQLLNTPANVLLEVSVTENFSDAYEFTVLRGTLQIQAFEKAVLKTGQQIQLKGQGLQKEQAKQQGLQRFEQQLQQAPLLKLIGVSR